MERLELAQSSFNTPFMHRIHWSFVQGASGEEIGVQVYATEEDGSDWDPDEPLTIKNDEEEVPLRPLSWASSNSLGKISTEKLL